MNGCYYADSFLLLLWIVIGVSINIMILRDVSPCGLVDNNLNFVLYCKLVSKVGIETEIFRTVGWFINHCRGF